MILKREVVLMFGWMFRWVPRTMDDMEMSNLSGLEVELTVGEKFE